MKEKIGFSSSVECVSDNWLRERFLNTINEGFTKCRELILKKNSDYTRLSPSDPFHNFHDSDIQSFLNRNNIACIDATALELLHEVGKKFRRIKNLLLTGEQMVLDESIEDTLLDTINYLAILVAHLKIHGKIKIKKDLETIDYKREAERLREHLDEARKDIQTLYHQNNAYKNEAEQPIETDKPLGKVKEDKVNGNVKRDRKRK